jgi:hypothetical protein
MENVIKLDNAKDFLQNKGILRKRVYGFNNKNRYQLVNEVTVQLSSNIILTIPAGYEWDLASVPRVFWSLIPPDSDAELAFLIHDFLYENKIGSRKFADKEMLLWSIVTNGTNNWSARNADNYIRYWAVRIGGSKYWKT